MSGWYRKSSEDEIMESGCLLLFGIIGIIIWLAGLLKEQQERRRAEEARRPIPFSDEFLNL